jgi:hypothetical protein
MRMVGRQLMVARFMMLPGFTVVLAGMLQMLGCLVMMFRCLLRHGSPPEPVWYSGADSNVWLLKECERKINSSTGC